MSWSAWDIARALATQVFSRKQLVVVPNCYWTGDECDLLVVRNDLRLVDVEVKISRADLKRDAAKDKWVDIGKRIWSPDSPYVPHSQLPRTPRKWPRRIWKHYFCMPVDIWKTELAEFISPASGVLLIYPHRGGGGIQMKVERQAKPCADAHKLKPEEVIDIARVSNVRMWDAIGRLRDSHRPPLGNVPRETESISDVHDSGSGNHDPGYPACMD